MPENKPGLLIDTDLGVDDTAALLPGLADSRFGDLAISAVHGNMDVDQVNRNVRQVLEYTRFNRIPVFPGSAVTMTAEPLKPSKLKRSDGLAAGKVGHP